MGPARQAIHGRRFARLCIGAWGAVSWKGTSLPSMTAPAQAIPRERTLDDSEIAIVWKACGDEQFGNIVKLLLLTGARRDEVATCRSANSL